jgi:hypothetical protein
MATGEEVRSGAQTKGRDSSGKRAAALRSGVAREDFELRLGTWLRNSPPGEKGRSDSVLTSGHDDAPGFRACIADQDG